MRKRKIIAAIDTSAAAGLVLATARAVAEMYDVVVEALHIGDALEHGKARAMAQAAGIELRVAEGTPSEALIAAAEPDDVAAMVLGSRALPDARRPIGRTAVELITALKKTVIVVPPTAARRTKLSRVLIALDGTREYAESLEGVIQLAQGRHVSLILVHVHEYRSAPRFNDQPQHETPAWAEEFLARYAPASPHDVEFHVGVGSPCNYILRIAELRDVHLIALSCVQLLAPGHSVVARELLERSEVPLLIVPARIVRGGP
ncbi:MAG: universal stress protein [Polyangiaceae bacterium]